MPLKLEGGVPVLRLDNDDDDGDTVMKGRSVSMDHQRGHHQRRDRERFRGVPDAAAEAAAMVGDDGKVRAYI